jgi:oligopeptide/dipeptide ABC transporter ATP-binding protein
MVEPILRVERLTKSFAVRKGTFGQQRFRLVAVEDVDLAIVPGETVGLVGESGCGKTTLGLTIMQLYPPTSGTVRVGGVDLARSSAAELRQARMRMQMIFQDPFASLDPRLNVMEIVTEPLDIHGIGSKKERGAAAEELLRTVGLPADAVARFPNEFSGGQQQRIGVARALALKPALLICDEPVSALDVSVQAQILNLLRDLQDSLRLAYLFISHNIGVTAFMANRIGVMYLGRIVELGPSDAVVGDPLHPYTKALISSIPEPEPGMRKDRRALRGEVPSPMHRPTGCSYHPRCPMAQAICAAEAPAFRPVRSDREVACHFVV